MALFNNLSQANLDSYFQSRRAAQLQSELRAADDDADEALGELRSAQGALKQAQSQLSAARDQIHALKAEVRGDTVLQQALLEALGSVAPDHPLTVQPNRQAVFGQGWDAYWAELKANPGMR